MRGKILLLLLIASVMLTSCTQVLNSPADEIRLYGWQSETNNGSEASLCFDGSVCRFDFAGGETSFTLEGQCFLTDDRLIISDDASGQNYSFGYRLYGDRAELSYNGSVLSLDKVSEDE